MLVRRLIAWSICRCLVVSLVGLAALVAAGCQTAGQDLSEFARALTPTTPSQAARMAFNLNAPDERRRGIEMLSNATFGGSDVYVKLYRDYAQNDTDPLVRAVAVRALARYGTPEDAPLVADNLSHDNEQVRWEAAKGLQRLHNERVIPAMLKVLRDDREPADTRAAIAWALGQYPQDRVVQGLIAALDARELSVNMAARDSLVTLTGHDQGLDAVDWLRWYEGKLASGDPYADREEYLYPTYSRDETFLERLMFWTTRNFEQPAPPAGLRHASERSTYEDVDEEPVTDQ